MSYLENKITIFVLSKNAEISARRFQFRIKSGENIRSVPLMKVLDFVVHYSVKVYGPAITLAAKHNIPIHFINNRGDYYGTFSNGLSANIFLRKAQYERRTDRDFILQIAQSIVEGKRANQQWTLNTLAKDLVLPSINKSKTLGSLLGQEGKAGALYWKYLPKVIKNPEFEFKKRIKHPPTNEINALLSLGYILLVNRITSILLYIGLDPYLGFYHQDFYKRPALALDLMEEWRPIAVDKFVLNLINRRELKRSDFVKEGIAIRLKLNPRNEFIKKWYDWWNKKELYSSVYKSKATLSKFCEWQCRKFSKVITGELQEYKPFKF